MRVLWKNLLYGEFMPYRLSLDHLPKKGRRVLIAEDETHIRRLLQIQLQACGCVVFAAEDGQQALDILAEQALDLVILDVMMPYIDGLDVLRQIRSNPETEALPVVLLTVKAQDHEVYDGIAAGADLYLTKPFDPKDVVGLVCS